MPLRWLGLGLLLLGAGAGCAVGLGEPCDADTPCPDELVCAFPQAGGTNAARGVCDYPLKKAGEPCTVVAECESTLTCSNHFTPQDRYGTCVAPRQNGEACFVARDCVSGRCEGASGTALDGTCAPKP